MAWMAGAIRKNIPPGGNDPPITPVGVILHVRAGTGDSLYPYFNGPSGGIESHFYIRFDGTIEQYRDTAREADANREGNSWRTSSGRKGFISVETEGTEYGEWTSAQLAAIKRLLSWASKMHNFPLRVCPTSKSPGVGYHVMFGAPGPWTPVAKSCPGPHRVEQFKNNIVPWMKSGETLPDTGGDWFDMATEAQLKKIVEAHTDKALADDIFRLKQIHEDTRNMIVDTWDLMAKYDVAREEDVLRLKQIHKQTRDLIEEKK